MSEILTDLSPSALIPAIEANYFELISSMYGSSPQMELYEGPDMIRFNSEVPHFYLNWVMHAQLVPDDIEGQITKALAPFKTHQLPMLWLTGPSTRPTNLGAYLEAHGLIGIGNSPGMAVNLRELNETLPPPRDLTIRCVTDNPTLKQWQYPFSIGFELPDFAANAFLEIFTAAGFPPQSPLRHYVGLVEDAPVASATLVLGAGVAGIYNVATIPAARRQGIGAALTLAALQDARDRGYRVGILYAAEMAVTLYRQLGFREYCTFGFYLFDPTPP